MSICSILWSFFRNCSALYCWQWKIPTILGNDWWLSGYSSNYQNSHKPVPVYQGSALEHHRSGKQTSKQTINSIDSPDDDDTANTKGQLILKYVLLPKSANCRTWWFYKPYIISKFSSLLCSESLSSKHSSPLVSNKFSFISAKKQQKNHNFLFISNNPQCAYQRKY